MAKYIVTYDLNKAGQDYSGLIGAIKAYPYSYPMKSAWLIKTNKTASEINTDLLRFIDANDRLFISEILGNNAGWLVQTDWDFLNN